MSTKRRFAMDAKLAICSLVLLVLLGSCTGKDLTENADPMTKPRAHNHNARRDIRIEQVHSHSSSHMHHMDPALFVFFFLEDLKQGNTMPVYFPKRDLSDTYRHLLPKEEADSIPFTSKKLDHLLKLFSVHENSPQAIAMEDTLRQCETDTIEGEIKLCATSYESMLDFTKSILGSKAEVEILSTSPLTRSDSDLLQKYTMMSIREIKASKTVSCHTMPYPYAIFYCHYQQSESKVYRVSLSGENGDKVEAVAVCHMDTSHWTSNHVAFQVLGIEPGSSPVCHFFPADNFVLVPSTSLVHEQSAKEKA